MIRVGICGFGYWGPNLFRSFAASRAFQVVAIADRRPDCQSRARALERSISVYADAEDLIDSGGVDAVAIATPIRTHYPLAARAVHRGVHVLVEKPLAASVDEARELVALARRHNVSILVDHVYVFHDAVLKLKEMIRADVLGRISYYDSLRVNLGLFQADTNVLWDLGPHDLSIMDYLFEEEPVHIETTGYWHVNSEFPDIVYVTAHYASRMIAHLNLSWMSPVKVRRIAVGGSKQMVVWDDLNSEERLKIYDSGIEYRSEEQRDTIMPTYRVGDVHSPRLSNHEPLARLVDHFADVIVNRDNSPVDGLAGLRVVRLLEKAQGSLEEGLRLRREALSAKNRMNGQRDDLMELNPSTV